MNDDNILPKVALPMIVLYHAQATFFSYGPKFVFYQRLRAMNRRLITKHYAHVLLPDIGMSSPFS